MSSTPQLLRCPTCGNPSGWRRCRRVRTHVTLKVLGYDIETETDAHEYECNDCKARVMDVDLTVIA